MSQLKRNVIAITDLRGGRNGTDSPTAIAENQCVEAWDVDWVTGMLARKRVGSVTVALTAGPTKDIRSLAPWRTGPGATEVSLISLSNNAGTVEAHALNSGGWGALTVGDAPTNGNDAIGVTINGTAYLAYDTAVNRLHAIDAGSTTIRRVGLQVPAAPTAANAGGGAYPATLRYYKVAYLRLSGAVILSRSELSPSVSFTPSGAGLAAQVNKPASLAEGETHWQVYASPDNVSYYLQSTIVVGTTAYLDLILPAAYTGDAPPTVGLNIPPPSVKALVADGPRLLMAGAYETSTAAGETEVKQNRVWITRVLGASGAGDLESIPNTIDQKNWVDLGENNIGGPVTGLGTPIDGVVFAFQLDRIWSLLPTGDDTAPYTRRCLTYGVGSVNHKSIIAAEDEQGRPALYFISRFGPYRLGADGLQSLTGPVEDLFNPVSVDTTIHGIYNANRRQIWWVQAAPIPAILVYDVKRNAYSRFTIPSTLTVNAAAMFNTTGVLVAMPYLGGVQTAGTTALLRRYDNTSVSPQASTDAGTTYRGYVRTRAYAPAGVGVNITTKTPTLVAVSATGVTITATAYSEFSSGVSPSAASGVCSIDSTATRVLASVQGCELGAMGAVQFEIGDAAAIDSVLWTLDAMTVPWEANEPR